MTKDQADELKRRIKAVEQEIVENCLGQYDDAPHKALRDYIDSLTQQPAELTDAEIHDVIAATPTTQHDSSWQYELKISRAVIAAHKAKEGKV